MTTITERLSPPRIVCAAIWRRGTNDLILGARHYDKLMVNTIQSRNESGEWRTAEQGFVDQHGRFYTREKAWAVAERNGQILFDTDWMRGSLHSEHLY